MFPVQHAASSTLGNDPDQRLTRLSQEFMLASRYERGTDGSDHANPSNRVDADDWDGVATAGPMRMFFGCQQNREHDEQGKSRQSAPQQELRLQPDSVGQTLQRRIYFGSIVRCGMLSWQTQTYTQLLTSFPECVCTSSTG